MPINLQTEKKRLIDFSGRLGHNPLFVQASTGNTSIKIDGTLWIKSSGTWLADADRADFLVPVCLAGALHAFSSNQDPTSQGTRSGMRASIETAMHAVLPHRVVVHVHSVNAIAWAIRADAPERLACLLRGLPWQWIPYVSSGVPLARAIQQTNAAQDTRVFVLGNHGLILCGDDCASVEYILAEVDRRLAITPAPAGQADLEFLSDIAAEGPWAVPPDAVLHTLALDPLCRSVLARGLLYPCQALFWHTTTPALFTSLSPSRLAGSCRQTLLSRPFLIIEERGVVVRRDINPADYAILLGLAHVVQRTMASAPIRYLTEPELSALNVDGGYYRALAHRGGHS